LIAEESPVSVRSDITRSKSAEAIHANAKIYLLTQPLFSFVRVALARLFTAPQRAGLTNFGAGAPISRLANGHLAVPTLPETIPFRSFG